MLRFSGECRNPERNLARSVLITAPVIALLYIFGTSAILAFVPPGAVDVTAAIPQALSRAFQPFGIGNIILPLAVILLLTNYVSTFNINFNGCARLPMVAGWDHLLPAWFTRLHPKYKTPVNSIFFGAGVAMAAAVAVLVGVGEQEAFELLLVVAFAFYATAYLALFAIPLLARKKIGVESRAVSKDGAASGFVMTLLYIVLSIFPIVDVQSSWEYSAKTAGGIIGANLLGVAIYAMGGKRIATPLRPFEVSGTHPFAKNAKEPALSAVEGMGHPLNLLSPIDIQIKNNAHAGQSGFGLQELGNIDGANSDLPLA